MHKNERRQQMKTIAAVLNNRENSELSKYFSLDLASYLKYAPLTSVNGKIIFYVYKNIFT